MPRGKVVVLCGLIGSGKSTLSRELAQSLGSTTLWQSEPDEKDGRNPYLADYYADPKRWALSMQVSLLSTRYAQHKQAQWHAMNTGHHAVTDASYWQDTSYARLQLKLGLMTEREFGTYQSLYHAMTASVLLPNVLVRILVSPETCNRRIAKRMEAETGRKCEQAIDLGYLQALDQEIDHMTRILKQMGVYVLEIPWDTDRDTPELRQAAVTALAARIQAIQSPDPFLDLHRRTV